MNLINTDSEVINIIKIINGDINVINNNNKLINIVLKRLIYKDSHYQLIIFKTIIVNIIISNYYYEMYMQNW